MGIYGLESFYHSNCDTTRFSIQTLLDEYRKENDSKEKPKVVFDGGNFVRHLYRELDWLCGGQMRQYTEKARRFIEKFKALDVDIVFFFEGPTVEEKRKVWVNRRCLNLKDVKTVMSVLKENEMITLYDQLKLKKLFMLPPDLGNFARFFCKLELGCEVYFSVKENSEELAEYARKNNCFAILAQDMDFLIYKGAKYFLSVRHLNIDDMTTIVYKSEILAKSLEIKAEELPLLATLSGSEIISTEKWRKFKHRRVALFRMIAEYIQKLSVNFDEDLDKVFKSISTDFFQNEEKFDLIKTSYETYTADSKSDSAIIDDIVATCPQPSNEWRKILQEGLRRHRNGEMSVQVWAVLSGKMFDLNDFAIEDFSANDLPTVTELFKPFRHRIYGILLKEKPLAEGQTSHKVLEWCVDGNFTAQSAPVSVEADTQFLKSGIPHPGLLKLWTSDAKSANIVDQRWNLFVKTVSPNLNVQKLKAIDAYLVFPTLAIKYLMENECINDHDARAFATLAVWVKKPSLCELESKPSSSQLSALSERAIRLATLYMRAFGMLMMLVTCIGGPVPVKENMPWYSFDGLLYQELYKNAVSHKREFSLWYTDAKAHKQYQTIMDLVRGIEN